MYKDLHVTQPQKEIEIFNFEEKKMEEETNQKEKNDKVG